MGLEPATCGTKIGSWRSPHTVLLVRAQVAFVLSAGYGSVLDATWTEFDIDICHYVFKYEKASRQGLSISPLPPMRLLCSTVWAHLFRVHLGSIKSFFKLRRWKKYPILQTDYFWPCLSTPHWAYLACKILPLSSHSRDS